MNNSHVNTNTSNNDKASLNQGKISQFKYKDNLVYLICLIGLLLLIIYVFIAVYNV